MFFLLPTGSQSPSGATSADASCRPSFDAASCGLVHATTAGVLGLVDSDAGGAS